MKCFALVTICFAALLNPIQALGQAGTSSASVGFARAGLRIASSSSRSKFRMPQPELFRVEEFINYHRHDLPLPDSNQRVRLDLQDLKLENGKSVLQVGLTTPRLASRADLPPLNIVLVVDESGSMSGNKIKNLKRALCAFVDRFRPSDRICIVGFESESRIILESTERTKIKPIKRAIDSIHAHGSTNLHAGLMSGYELALQHFDAERTNRLIFLTDGNANVGVTESKEIAQRSQECIDQGISLVTVGLGVDFNHGLLRELSDAGRGVMHYVGDAKDIQKLFVDEFDSVLGAAAKDVQLTVQLSSNDARPKFYGYETAMQRISGDDEPCDGRYVFKLDDLNYGATQVMLAKLQKSDGPLSGKIKLSYIDTETGETVKQSVSFNQRNASRNADRRSIKRNYAIALIANSLRSAAIASNEGDNQRAAKRLRKAISKSKQVCDNQDDHVDRVLNIAKDYQKLVARK